MQPTTNLTMEICSTIFSVVFFGKSFSLVNVFLTKKINHHDKQTK